MNVDIIQKKWFSKFGNFIRSTQFILVITIILIPYPTIAFSSQANQANTSILSGVNNYIDLKAAMNRIVSRYATIYYNRRLISSSDVPVTFNAGEKWLKFDVPPDFVDQIDELKPDVIAKVKKQLSQKIDTDFRNCRFNCPVLVPDAKHPIRLLFDKALGKTILYFDKSLLQPQSVVKKLTAASNGLSLTNHLIFQQTGAFQNSNDFAQHLYTFNQFSLYETYLVLDTDMSRTKNNGQDFHFSALNLVRRLNMYEYKFGLLNTTGNIFISNEDILGFLINTNDETTLLNAANWNQSIEIFTNNYNERIELYTGSILMASHSFELPGHHILRIHTTTVGYFPITIKHFIGNDELIKTEHQQYGNYRKSWPRFGQSKHIFAVGFLENTKNRKKVLPEFYMHIPVADYSYSRLLTKNIGLSTNLIASSPHQVFFTSDLTRLFSRSSISLSGLLGPGDYGLGVGIDFFALPWEKKLKQRTNFNAGLNLQKIWGSPTRDDNDDGYVNNLDESGKFDPLTIDKLTLSGNLKFSYQTRMNLGRENSSQSNSISANIQLYKSEHSKDVKPNYQLSYSLSPLFRLQNIRTNLSIQISKSDDLSLLATLTFNFDSSNSDFSHDLRVNYDYNRDEDKQSDQLMYFDAKTTYRKTWKNNIKTSAEASLNKLPHDSRGNINGEIKGYHGDINLSLSHEKTTKSKSLTRYQIEAEGGFILTPHHFSLKYSNNLSGVGLAFPGLSEEDGVQVLIKDYQGRTRVNKTILPGHHNKYFFDLVPYQQYTITVLPNGLAHSYQQIRQQKFTLYQGVYHLKLEMVQKHSLRATILNQHHHVLAEAKIVGINGEKYTKQSMTDSDGELLIDLPVTVKTLLLKSKSDKICEVELPKTTEPIGSYRFLDQPLICHTVKKGSLSLDQGVG